MFPENRHQDVDQTKRRLRTTHPAQGDYGKAFYTRKCEVASFVQTMRCGRPTSEDVHTRPKMRTYAEIRSILDQQTKPDCSSRGWVLSRDLPFGAFDPQGRFAAAVHGPAAGFDCDLFPAGRRKLFRVPSAAVG